MILLLLFLLGTANGVPKLPTVKFENRDTQIHIDDVVAIPFSIEGISQEFKINITATTSDVNILNVSLPKFDQQEIRDEVYKSSINVTGIFLGKAKISLIIYYDEVIVFY